MSYQTPTEHEVAGLAEEARRLALRMRSRPDLTTVYQELRRQAPDAHVLEHTRAINEYLRWKARTTEALFTLGSITHLKVEFDRLNSAQRGTVHRVAARRASQGLQWVIPFYRLLFDDGESWEAAQKELQGGQPVSITAHFAELWMHARQLRLVQPWYAHDCYHLNTSIYAQADAAGLAKELLTWATPIPTPNGESVLVLGWPRMDHGKHRRTVQLASKASGYATASEVRQFLEESPAMIKAEREAEREWSVEHGKQTGANNYRIADYWVAKDLVQKRVFSPESERKRKCRADHKASARRKISDLVKEYRASRWGAEDNAPIPTILDMEP